MIVEIKVPSPGESITEVQIAGWLVANGQQVNTSEDVVEIDSDKATLSVAAGAEGKITILVDEGTTVEVNSVIATIDTEAKGTESGKISPPKTQPAEKADEPVKKTSPAKEKVIEPMKTNKTTPIDLHISPLAKKLMEINQVTESDLVNFYKNYRVGKKDVEFYLENKDQSPSGKPVTQQFSNSWTGIRESKNTNMSPLRKKLAARLVSVKNETAMLTTFNEVNMTPIMDLRKKYKEAFIKKHDISLGFMSFFTKAVTEAMAFFPQVNAQISADQIIHFDYVDVSIAVSAPKGLVVPVIRNAEMLSLAELEMAIKELATKARDNKLSLEEMQGGTFTITNGGVFGSMMSTPIINPPQSAILGMHNIVERPIAVDGSVEIHPMMYIALSYDHRVIDGRDSVGFLVKVKELLEHPERMLFGSRPPEEILLGL
ncbi:MAG: dihydrolipoyllysine-residue succinyltransferase [Bacteroidetes bacterium HGW-Bacteroidetes-16]|jgi:2-oxoglutarate dehydrogenase E2 component (dihydrolipoamide succinyltransferase)|nr:MAG: dihydrolipoyllysine-residue succinyltransferase [Bacteroidetes bacterium HGW-Bacteroidetes-16]